MELNQFRNVDVVLDKANDNIIQKQFVSAGDKDGRSLTVQLTDNGVIGEIIGAALNLYWHNQASGLTDLSAFYVVDKATSVFKIDYPQNMLTPGKVIAYIQIIHGGKVTHTKPFEITVQKLAGTTRGVLATAEYSALVTTLAKANEFETEIAKKADKVYVDTVLSSIVSGGPKELFYSLAALKAKYPNGAQGTYLVFDAIHQDGAHSYMWQLDQWNDLGVYQALSLELSSVKTENFSDTIKGKNLFNKRTVVKGVLDRRTGLITENDLYRTSGFMLLDANQSYIVSPQISLNRTMNVVYYDSNRVRVADTQIGPTDTPVILSPIGRCLVRISFEWQILDALQVERGTKVTEYEEYYQYFEEMTANPIDKEIGLETVYPETLAGTVKGKNLFNKNSVVEGYLDRSTGEVIYDNGFRTSTYIVAPKYKKINLSTIYELYGNINICLYDRTRNFVSAIQFNESNKPWNLTLTGSEALMRVSVSISSLQTLQVEVGDHTTEYEEYYNYFPDITANPSTQEVATDIIFYDYSASKKELNIYVPAGKNKMFNYVYKHEKKLYEDGGLYQNSDLWRLNGGNLLNYNYLNGERTDVEAILNNGAWETAIQISGLPDFHGTYHGYELMDEVRFYADGSILNLSEDSVSSGKEFTVVYRARLIKQGTENVVIADIVRFYNWTTEGLELRQRINWTADFPNVIKGYMAMMPIKRLLDYNDANSKIITDATYSDFDFIQYDVSDTASSPVNTAVNNVTLACVYGAESGISARLKMKYHEENKNNTYHLANEVYYNKMYFSYGDSIPVKIGDVWESSSKYHFCSKK